MATASPQAGVHVVTLPTLSLRQILLVHLIIFQEALFGCHVPGINISWMNQASQNDIPIAFFTGEGRLRSPDTVRLNSDNAYRAVIFKHYCETFCVMMKPFITRHLYKLFGISNSVKWINFFPSPLLRMLKNADEMNMVIYHSCILISDGNGGGYVVDGTADQYGRYWKAHWFMTLKELITSYLDPMDPAEGRIWTTIRRGEVATRNRLEGPECPHGSQTIGYWVVARRRMEQIFQELDWNSLRGLSEDDIEEQIRSRSKAWFAGAFKEAQAK